ncbi:EpsI family protein [Luteolibacter arcticus]|uniref:EpsI family protein n=1 Tax=Luteolibacter arcticus TaxID=1581411 RepID=A0ABT3GJ69_9BACT|nr:EpsI family protein [Luteolibacter arcticus]MCW1923557.1 EpsI family protein [Luteolibacter arcticus]
MKRGLILLGVLVTGLSAVFLLPDFKTTNSALSLTIPKQMAAWTFTEGEPTKEERDTLAKDTTFAKARCERSRSGSTSYFDTGPKDHAQLSIVMSGIDLANSIHRPERCMPAQGHEIYGSATTLVDVRGSKQLPARRLLSVQEIPIDELGKNVIHREAVTYYFFVGSEQITENHTRRTLIDIKDRLMKGEAQRWAYISVTMWFNGDLGDKHPDLLDLAGADRVARELLGELAAKNIAWEQVKQPG